MEQATVPALSIIFMVVSFLVSVGLPIFLLILLYKKQKVGPMPPLLGAAGFILFVLVLESLLHQYLLVGNETTARFFENSTFAYVLYACLAAGIFEETARLLSFLLIRRRQDNPYAALAYGVGHGGAEAIILVGLTMLSNIVLAFTINSGGAAALLNLSGLSADAAVQASSAIQKQIDALTGASPALFLVAGLERAAAITIQLSLSVLVWLSVSRIGKFWFYPLAIGLHAAVDVVAALSQRGVIKSLSLVEGLIVASAVGLVLFARWAYGRCLAEADKTSYRYRHAAVEEDDEP